MHPCFRHPLEVSIEKFDQHEVVVFQCPLGLLDAPVVLQGWTAPILRLIDGQNSIEEIKGKLPAVPASLVDEILSFLDNAFLLQTPRYEERYAAYRQQFAAETERKSICSGGAYPSDARELEKLVKQYLLQSTPVLPDKEQIEGILAPHIDYLRGGKGYGEVYSLLQNVPCDIIILIGTNHQSYHGPFIGTRKDFLLPGCRFKNFHPFFDKLSEYLDPAVLFTNELAHKREHSLELELPFILHTLGNKPIVPFLVGNFSQGYNEGEANAVPEFAPFVHAMTETVRYFEQQGKKFFWVVSGDLSHIGTYFGDSFALTPEKMQEIRNADEKYLSYFTEGEETELFRWIASHHNSTRICGYTPLITTLSVLRQLGRPCYGKEVSYHQAVNEARGCGVTFAGALLMRQFKPFDVLV